MHPLQSQDIEETLSDQDSASEGEEQRIDENVVPQVEDIPEDVVPSVEVEEDDGDIRDDDNDNDNGNDGNGDGDGDVGTEQSKEIKDEEAQKSGPALNEKEEKKEIVADKVKESESNPIKETKTDLNAEGRVTKKESAAAGAPPVPTGEGSILS